MNYRQGRLSQPSADAEASIPPTQTQTVQLEGHRPLCPRTPGTASLHPINYQSAFINQPEGRSTGGASTSMLEDAEDGVPPTQNADRSTGGASASMTVLTPGLASPSFIIQPNGGIYSCPPHPADRVCSGWSYRDSRPRSPVNRPVFPHTARQSPRSPGSRRHKRGAQYQ